MRSLRRSPAKHIDLLPQDQVSCLQLCSRPEERSQDAKNQLEQIGHQAASLPRSFLASTPNRNFRYTQVAGFGTDDLNLEAKENTLTIRGEKQSEKEESTFLHRGIAARSFERKFQLADHVVVKGAGLENGLLHVELVRELPEAMKPRAIPIATIETKSEKPKVIDSKAA